LNLPEVMRHWHAQGPETLLAQAGQRLPFWVSLLLVIAIAYQLSRLVWLLVPGPAPAAWLPPPVAAMPPAASGPAAGANYASISAAHLFGKAEARAEAQVPASPVEDAPQTQLQLQLRGAIAALDERFAHAIIADGSGREKVYFIRDPLPGGATLQQVQPDRVILSRGGILESLLLPRSSAGGTVLASPPPPPGPVARRPMSTMQEVVSQRAASIGDILRPQPFMPNGELKGYRVYPGRNRAQFVALGLRPGDLVTEINGLALNNPALAMEAFRSLANTTQVNVTIERDGQPQNLMLDANQVAAATEQPAGEGAAEPPEGEPAGAATGEPQGEATEATAQQ